MVELVYTPDSHSGGHRGGSSRPFDHAGSNPVAGTMLCNHHNMMLSFSSEVFRVLEKFCGWGGFAIQPSFQ